MKRLAVILLLALLALVAVVASWWTPGLVERDLTARINDTLQASQSSQLVTAELDGRFVSLSGTVEQENMRGSALETAEDVYGGLAVAQDLGVLPTASPYRFSIEKHSDGKVSLSGFVQNKSVRQDLIDHAYGLFGRENVSAELELAAGMPDATWPGMAKRGMDAMDKVIFGEANMLDRRLSVTGVAESFTFVDLAKEAVTSDIPEAYKNQGGLLDIRWQPPLIQPYRLQLAKESKDTGVTARGVRSNQGFQDQLVATLEQDGKVASVELEDGRGAPTDNWESVALDAARIPGQLVSGSVVLTDAQIEVSGVLENQEAANNVDTIIAEIPQPYVVRKDLAVLPPVVSPYGLTFTNTDGALSATGVVPSAQTLGGLSQLVPNADLSALTLARGVPDEQWSSVAGLSARAASALKTGQATLTDRQLVVAGEIEDQASLDALKAQVSGQLGSDYTADLEDVSVLPVRLDAPIFDAIKNEDGQVDISASYTSDSERGALEAAVRAADFDVAPSLNLQKVRTQVPGNWQERQTQAIQVLSGMSEGSVSLSPDQLSASGYTALSGDEFDTSFGQIPDFTNGVVSTFVPPQPTTEETTATETDTVGTAVSVSEAEVTEEVSASVEANETLVETVTTETTTMATQSAGNGSTLGGQQADDTIEASSSETSQTTETTSRDGTSVTTTTTTTVTTTTTELSSSTEGEVSSTESVTSDGTQKTVTVSDEKAVTSSSNLTTGEDATQASELKTTSTQAIDVSQDAQEGATTTGTQETQVVETTETTQTTIVTSTTGNSESAVELKQEVATSASISNFSFDGFQTINGFEIPNVTGEFSAASCRRNANDLLAEKKLEFETGSARLSSENNQSLNRLASIISACADKLGIKVSINGYTDSQGAEDSNLELSQRRADAVKEALMQRGIKDENLTTKGFGEENPIADNETAEGRAQNRRIEFEILEN